jgi:hypothetical protein
MPIEHNLTGEIQPVALRAPEIILGIKWDTAIDIWGAGCVVDTLDCTAEIVFRISCWARSISSAGGRHLENRRRPSGSDDRDPG